MGHSLVVDPRMYPLVFYPLGGDRLGYSVTHPFRQGPTTLGKI